MYDPIKAQKVCELLESGDPGCESLRKCCALADVKPSTFLLWCDGNKGLAEHYARVSDICSELQFEGLVECVKEEPERGKFGIDAAWVQLKRLEVDTIKWALSKRKPSKYGDKIEHSGQINLGLAAELAEARKRKLGGGSLEIEAGGE